MRIANSPCASVSKFSGSSWIGNLWPRHIRLEAITGHRLSQSGCYRCASTAIDTRGYDNGDPRIHIDSLRQTLDAHRASPRRNPNPKSKEGRYYIRRIDFRHIPVLPKKGKRRVKQQIQKGGLGVKKPSLVPALEWFIPSSSSPTLAQRCPWMDHLDDAAYEVKDPLQRLNAEIKAFETFLSLTPEEQQIYDRIYADLLCQSKLDQSGAQLIGSHSSGLARVFSDLDINLSAATQANSRQLGQRGPSPGSPMAHKRNIRHLRKTLKELEASGTKDFEAILVHSAKVPILNGMHRPTAIGFDIQCTTSGRDSLEYAKNYVHEIPVLRALYFVVRHFLHMRNSHSAKSGGIGSYATLIMLVASFKLHQGRYDRFNYADPFLDFLDFFSTFDFRQNGISVEPPEIFQRHVSSKTKSANRRDTDDVQEIAPHYLHRLNLLREDQKHGPREFLLQDPAAPSINLGRSSRKVGVIQAIFATAVKDMRQKIKEYETASVKEKLNVALLSPMVGGNYVPFLDRRAAFLLAGSRMHIR